MDSGLITRARRDFQRTLVEIGPLSVFRTTIDKGKTTERKELVASNADVSQRTSRDVAMVVARTLKAREAAKGPGQTAGRKFEDAVTNFLRTTLPCMQAVRPGRWKIENVGGTRRIDHVAKYHPYRHLDELAQAVERDSTLQSILGNSYVVSPDILVLREAEPDETINSSGMIVDDQTALMTPFRAANASRRLEPEVPTPSFVHAVVSCKWTMRSDRSQNARSEALNLIRNRKGRAPHIVAVTAEPSMSRIASLALGTGDIDIVYHAALPELVDAVTQVGNDESLEMLEVLMKGDRLRDVSDLPVDLAV
ncbi:NgoMIV family type II restriction endonuclease [Gordonia paraffinivorans]|uniref:NgoMIV family type II restriction endonuclease n=1 Tax=Gordonia paraffinivorans TaxID=175628 RepID=UPI001E48E0D6|nr:NgoMIV family type II restriction endonuclease [Gordonia paraffinivorans]MCD2144548.1 NgoMIV family type II restriction endonuclease [Gordonia paraffinivorans]